jgi:hypothetical protein
MSDELLSTRPPIVMDVDRKWALEQCPPWAVRATPADHDWLDDGNPDDAPPVTRKSGVLIWDFFVTSEVERFERFFADQRKTPADWSTLWRKSWWPKADPRKRYRSLVPASAGKPHPFFRAGTREFEEALKLGTPIERKVWAQVGVAQFTPDDKRVKRLLAMRDEPAGLTPLSRAMTGERS